MENTLNLKNAEDIINYIKETTKNSKDIVYKNLKINDGNNIYIVYSESVTDSKTISDFIVRSISNVLSISKTEDIRENVDKITGSILSNSNEQKEENDEGSKNDKKVSLVEKINKKRKENSNLISNVSYADKSEELIKTLDEKLSIGSVKKIDINSDNVFKYIFSGFACIIYEENVIVAETKANLDRSIAEPTTEKVNRGPKDSFIENYMTNIGLIRKRLKTEKLILDEQSVGRRSETKIGILYVDDIAKKELVDLIRDKIKKIDIDGIIGSNYIVEMIDQSSSSNFPTTISTERPDLVSYYLLQGRIAIVVENSPFVIVVPAFFMDFVNSTDDNFQKSTDVTLTKIIRYIALFVTLFTPALYIALITYNQESIPTDLLLAFSTQRQGVPFPAYIEAFLMIISFEILREGDYRVPNASGSTLSIVGALILGDAAVNAGIVSPIMIIVIAITTISGLLFNDINMANALRTWRIIFMLFASIIGLLGIGICMVIFLTSISSVTSFNKPYTYPFAPFNFFTIKKEILERRNFAKDKKRKKILTDNLTKAK